MPNKINLIGQKINMLHVMCEYPPHILPSGKTRTMWLCLCDCGNYAAVSTQSLIQGTTISCGCYGKQARSTGKYAKIEEAFLGKRFGRWVVESYAGIRTQQSGQTRNLWNCICDCGTKKQLTSNQLKKGSLSCGCLRREITSAREMTDLTGKYAGYLYIIERIGTQYAPSGQGSVLWLCQCVCGNLYCSTTQRLIEGRTTSCGCKRGNDITGLRSGMLVALYKKDKKWVCQCDCGNLTSVYAGHFKAGSVTSCGCLKKSWGEINIEKWLMANNITYATQYKFADLRGPGNGLLRFDFALLDDQNVPIALIEYQGKQHFIDCDFGRLEREVTDNMKKEYCRKANIPLYEICYNEHTDKRCVEIINSLHVNTVPSSQEIA